MEAKNFNYIAFGMGRLNDLRSFREKAEYRLDLKWEHNDFRLPVGGQWQNLSSSASRIDENIRATIEEGNALIINSIKESIQKAENLLIEELQKLGVNF